MSRDYRVFVDDILEAVGKIQNYTSGMSFEELKQDAKTLDAVIRNLEIIGEAAKKIPENIRLKTPLIEWKRIAGLRDILIHEYFGIDIVIIWDILQNKLPTLLEEMKKIT